MPLRRFFHSVGVFESKWRVCVKCLHVSRSVRSLTAHREAADQKGPSPSTSWLVFQPALRCVSHNTHEEPGGLVAFSSRALQPPRHAQLHRKGFFRCAKGAGE